MILEESFVDTPDCQEEEQVENDETEAVLLRAHQEKAGLSGKDNAGKDWRQQEKRKTKEQIDWLPEGSHLHNGNDIIISDRLLWVKYFLFDFCVHTCIPKLQKDAFNQQYLLLPVILYRQNYTTGFQPLCSIMFRGRREENDVVFKSPFLIRNKPSCHCSSCVDRQTMR